MPRRKAFPPIGSISSGTLRTEDLLSAFADYCRDYGGREGQKLNREYERMSPEEVEGEEGGYLLEEMTDCLQNVAPDFVNFGAHEGDGAEFGFWPSIESLEEHVGSPESSDVIKVDSLDNVPSKYIGHVMRVNDHGNVTLYWKSARKLKEIWSCV